MIHCSTWWQELEMSLRPCFSCSEMPTLTQPTIRCGLLKQCVHIDHRHRYKSTSKRKSIGTISPYTVIQAHIQDSMRHFCKVNKCRHTLPEKIFLIIISALHILAPNFAVQTFRESSAELFVQQSTFYHRVYDEQHCDYYNKHSLHLLLYKMDG